MSETYPKFLLDPLLATPLLVWCTLWAGIEWLVYVFNSYYFFHNVKHLNVFWQFSLKFQEFARVSNEGHIDMRSQVLRRGIGSWFFLTNIGCLGTSTVDHLLSYSKLHEVSFSPHDGVTMFYCSSLPPYFTIIPSPALRPGGNSLVFRFFLPHDSSSSRMEATPIRREGKKGRILMHGCSCLVMRHIGNS